VTKILNLTCCRLAASSNPAPLTFSLV